MLACSALKQRYRERLAQAGELRFVYLRGKPGTIAARLAVRRHRYMPAALLASQFATLEPPADAIDIDIAASVDAQVRAIIAALAEARCGDHDGSSDATGIATDVAHLGRDPRRYLGAVNTPVFRASTILLPSVADLEQAARGEYPGLSYGLHGLPTVTDLQRALATLEGGHAALVVPSGLTATTFPLLALREARRPRARHRCRLRPDAPLLRQPSAPPRHRRRATTIRWSARDIARGFRPNTTLVFAESPGSLTFEVQDIPAIAAVAHARGARVDPRQHVGDAARLSRVRSRRRRHRCTR